MKNNTKKIIIIAAIVLAVILTSSIVIFNLLKDKNAFSVNEKKYIINNKSNLISINVVNDANVFGRDGKGVFYDYLESFEKEVGLSFNIVTNSVTASPTGLSLTKGSVLPKEAKLFYTDHYVLIGKNYTSVAELKDITSTIGYINSDEQAIKDSISKYSLTLKNYENREGLLQAFDEGEISYIIVPELEYLDVVLSNLYAIVYHLSDAKDYYYMTPNDNETLSSIMKKYYNTWSSKNQKDSFNKNEYALFTSRLKITEKELDVINNKKYRYGFIENGPYDIKTSGVYGGLVSKYVKEFSEFSGITFEYDEYKKYDKFTRAISRGEVDLFLNYYSFSTSMTVIESLYQEEVSFLMNNADSRIFRSLASIRDEVIYVKENSSIATFLKNNGIEIQTYRSDKDLKKIFKNNGIVAMNYANYMIYKEENSNINERFREYTRTSLNFYSNNDTMFNRLFSYYISTIDKNEILYTGIDNYNKMITSGSLIYKVTKYAVLLILIIGLIVLASYKIGKRVFVRKKIKRSDKMKYIDLLTSLKNRNFLSENIPIWNQNTIYPQAVVVIDLNSIQELNDSYGYLEGDKQIQAAANALIKTQLDNSELMRTDGNEFTVYLVGYSEKQIISYIKKLNKEFKNLPYDKGAAVGFSIIEDDVKLIGDAINEATEKMKENKMLQLGDKDGEKI